MKKNYNPIASKCVCNTIANVIYDIEYGIDDRVLVGSVNIGSEIAAVPHYSKIRYNTAGDAYFMHYGKREYLNDYMRIN